MVRNHWSLLKNYKTVTDCNFEILHISGGHNAAAREGHDSTQFCNELTVVEFNSFHNTLL